MAIAAPALGPGPLPDVPVLLLKGEDDLRTPNEGARSAAADWPHAQVLVVPNTGHSVLTADLTNCTSRAVRNFFRDRPWPPPAGAAHRCSGRSRLGAWRCASCGSARRARGQRGEAINALELTLFDVTVEFLSTLISANDNTVHGGGLRGGRWALKLGEAVGAPAPGRCRSTCRASA